MCGRCRAGEVRKCTFAWCRGPENVDDDDGGGGGEDDGGRSDEDDAIDGGDGDEDDGGWDCLP